MKLIFHIAKKDAARVWPLWLPWLGVAAAKLALAFAVARNGYLEIGTFSADNVSVGLAGLDAALTYLLAAWLMLEDAPMNTRHFGLTRPVGRGTLLAAKLVGALGLLWLPAVAVWSPWWVYCGFTTGDMLAEAGVVLAGTALAVLPAFLVASLVDSFRRVLLWTPVWLGALMIGVPVPFMWMISRSVGARGLGSSDLGENAEVLGLWQSRLWLAGATLVVGAAALLAWQFFRRRPRGTVAGLAAVFALVVTIMLRAPWNFWPDRGEWAEAHPERARGVEPELASARMYRYEPQSYPAPDLAKRNYFRLELRWRASTASNVVAWPLRSSLRVESDGGGFWWNDGGTYLLAKGTDDGEVWRMLDFGAAPARPREAGPTDGAGAPGVFRAESGFVADVYGTSPKGAAVEDAARRLNGRMLLAQVEYRVPAPRAVELGRWTSGEGRTVRVSHVDRSEHGVVVAGVDTRRARLAERGWAEYFARLAARRERESLSDEGVLLADGWNRARGTGMTLRWWQDWGTGRPIGGVLWRRFTLPLSPPGETRDGARRAGEVTDEWVAGLRLVAVERRETARVYREVAVDPLRIETER